MTEHDPATPAYRDTVVDQEALAETRADVPVSEVEYQEGRPPLEHTQRVRAKQAASAPPAGSATATRTSTELAGPSQRQRRRERDHRAESAALRTIFAVFLIAGVGVFALLNSGLFDDAPPPPRPSVELGSGAETKAAEPKPPPVVSTKAEETRHIPALANMSSDGLTIGAEGLPQVVPLGEVVPPASVVGLEACRFAYGVWEFSPNNAFRFLTTCGALKGQVLVGAYEIDARAGLVRLSPVRAGDSVLTSTFEVERPSRMTTRVLVGGHEVEVRQKITVMRPGMEGEGFARGLGERNQLQVQGGGSGGGSAPAPAPAPAPRPPPRDPVLDLLQGE